MRAWAWFSSTWTLRLLERRFSSNIYIVSRLLEMASFITQPHFFVFCSFGQRCGKKPAGIVIFLVSLQYFESFIYRANKFQTPHKRWLGSLKYVYLDKFYKQLIPRAFRVLNASRQVFSNCRFHPVEKPLSDTTKPTWEIYLYNFLPRSTICQGFLVT